LKNWINCSIYPKIYFRILGLGLNLGFVALALHVSDLGLGVLALALTLGYILVKTHDPFSLTILSQYTGVTDDRQTDRRYFMIISEHCNAKCNVRLKYLMLYKVLAAAIEKL